MNIKFIGTTKNIQRKTPNPATLLKCMAIYRERVTDTSVCLVCLACLAVRRRLTDAITLLQIARNHAL